MNKHKTLKETILEALDEELYSPEEYLTEMSKVADDKSNGGMMILISIDQNRIGEPYFKVVDNINYNKAKRIARISFLHPEYIIHKNTDEKTNWTLNNKEKKQFKALLEKVVDIGGVTAWNRTIIQYNLDKYNIDALETLKKDVENYTKKDLQTKALPYNLPMPDYMKL